jgi:hypothetical protein
MPTLLKAMDGYKTYAGCILSVAIAAYAYHYYPTEFPLKDLIGSILLAGVFVTNRMGNKADTAKVIESTNNQTITLTKQVDRAVDVAPCAENSLNKAVDAIVNRQNNQN